MNARNARGVVIWVLRMIQIKCSSSCHHPLPCSMMSVTEQVVIKGCSTYEVSLNEMHRNAVTSGKMMHLVSVLSWMEGLLNPLPTLTWPGFIHMTSGSWWKVSCHIDALNRPYNYQWLQTAIHLIIFQASECINLMPRIWSTKFERVVLHYDELILKNGTDTLAVHLIMFHGIGQHKWTRM